MTRTAIIAAMPGELKPLVHGWAYERRGSVDLWRWKFDEGEWIAACAGAGVEAATRAFAEVERDGAVDQVISTGWAGALNEEFKACRVYAVSGVIDARTGERFEAEDLGDSSDVLPRSENPDLGHPDDKVQPQVLRLRSAPLRMTERVGHPGIWLVTSQKVADATEKLRLVTVYGAGLVDMEAAAIARLAQMRGIPFYCFKGVSDGFNDNLPDFNRFITPQGRFQLPRFILFAALRPIYWPTLIQMGENSKKASQSIREALLDFLDERADIRQRNGYPNIKH